LHRRPEFAPPTAGPPNAPTHATPTTVGSTSLAHVKTELSEAQARQPQAGNIPNVQRSTTAAPATATGTEKTTRPSAPPPKQQQGQPFASANGAPSSRPSAAPGIARIDTVAHPDQFRTTSSNVTGSSRPPPQKAASANAQTFNNAHTTVSADDSFDYAMSDLDFADMANVAALDGDGLDGALIPDENSTMDITVIEEGPSLPTDTRPAQGPNPVGSIGDPPPRPANEDGVGSNPVRGNTPRNSLGASSATARADRSEQIRAALAEAAAEKASASASESEQPRPRAQVQNVGTSSSSGITMNGSAKPAPSMGGDFNFPPGVVSYGLLPSEVHMLT
jgi:hypothetical protein